MKSKRKKKGNEKVFEIEESWGFERLGKDFKCMKIKWLRRKKIEGMEKEIEVLEWKIRRLRKI